MMTQTEARREAKALNDSGHLAIAEAVSPGSWGGTEQGWRVKVLDVEALADEAEQGYDVDKLGASRRCGICGEHFRSDGSGSDAQAEMYDPGVLRIVLRHRNDTGPAHYEAPSALVHAECGLARGWEVA